MLKADLVKERDEFREVYGTQKREIERLRNECKELKNKIADKKRENHLLEGEVASLSGYKSRVRDADELQFALRHGKMEMSPDKVETIMRTYR
jgi:hypothetical protein